MQELENHGFVNTHKEAFPNDRLYDGGWPDTGNGRFTKKMGYKVWYEINKYQRPYANYAENIQQITASSLIGGLFMPLTISIWLGLYFISRVIYGCGYVQHPKKRFWGAPFIVFTQLMMPLFAFTCCIVFFYVVPVEDLNEVKSGLWTELW